MPPESSAASPAEQFLTYVKKRAQALRANDKPPASLADWNEQAARLRRNLERSWGPFPKEPCPLEPRVLGELKRAGYRVEKLVFQTRPGILMTANLYLPDGAETRSRLVRPRALARRQQESRGAIAVPRPGETRVCRPVRRRLRSRRTRHRQALGEYHGEMTAATLFSSGLTLAGLQVYENMRAVDFLATRPEVDGTRIGITGASGGGNQTMYAGAYDARFRAVVPTCSVGTYLSYIGTACCMCEVVPGALTYTEEWGLLSLVAPRALMVINATQDAFQFSVGEAEKSLARAKQVFELFCRADSLKHAVFESKHDYNRPMREAMYGWMTRFLKEEGDGSPIAEPEFQTEDPETLRCYPGETRPKSFVTLPQFAAAQSRDVLSNRVIPDHREHWASEAQLMHESLAEGILGEFPMPGPLNVSVDKESNAPGRVIKFDSEPGITLRARHEPGDAKPRRLALLLDLESSDHAIAHPLATALKAARWDILTCDLRATGPLAPPHDNIGQAPDHNSAQWSIWTGRPLLGQWIWDIHRLLDALNEADPAAPRHVAAVGLGPAGIVALAAAAMEPRIMQVAAVGTLVSFISDVPYRDQRMGIIVPGMLRSVGDVPHLASLVEPRTLVIAGSVTSAGAPLPQDQLERQFEYTRSIYRLVGQPGRLVVKADCTPEDVVKYLNPAAV